MRDDEIDIEGREGTLNIKKVPQGSEQRAHQFHSALERTMGACVNVTFTNNRKRMIGVTRPGQGLASVRLHHMFLDCDAELIHHIANFVQGADDRVLASSRVALRTYIQRHRGRIEHTVAQKNLNVVGEHHNLGEVLQEVLSLLIPEELQAEINITWGRRGKGRRSIQFGSYDYEQRLIRVHPVLDQSWVPHEFVAFIVYHEVLHELCPPQRSVNAQGELSKRRHVHTEEFRRREREFPYYDEVLSWESANIRRLLRAD